MLLMAVWVRYMPKAFMQAVIVRLIKDKSGDLYDIINYIGLLELRSQMLYLNFLNQY